MTDRELWWLRGEEVGRRRCTPAAWLLALGVAGGLLLHAMLVTPLIVHARVAAVQAAWDADVQASVDRCAEAYAQGRRDAEELAAMARECGE